MFLQVQPCLHLRRQVVGIVVLTHQDGFHEFLHLVADALGVSRLVVSVDLIEIVIVENRCICYLFNPPGLCFV